MGGHRRRFDEALWLPTVLSRTRPWWALYTSRSLLLVVEGEGVRLQTRFIELAGEINVSMPYHVVTAISMALNNARKPLNGSRVLILGVSYKKDVDDLRESPALTIIELLKQRGAIVNYHDPSFPVLPKGSHYDLQMERVPLDNIGEYDFVSIITDHSDYDYTAIVREAQLVIDTRNATRGIDSPKVVRC